jgi:ribose/xylose/arabinose/galactoside ABC-type transport system permease subunit
VKPVVIALGVLAALAALFAPGFLTVGNLTTILLHVSVNAMLALGMTFVIITGGIDLSVGSLVALAGVLAAGALTGGGTLNALGPGGAAVLAAVVGMLVGTAVGAVNGAVTAYGRIAPFVVTLATMTIARGAARLFTGGVPIGYPPAGDPLFAQKGAALDALHAFGGGRIPVPGLARGFPVPALIMLALVALLVGSITILWSVTRWLFGTK